MILDELLKVSDKPETQLITWGDVSGTTPTLVRLRGDTADTQIDLWLTSYTPTTNDRVILLKVGGSWVILGDMV